MIDRTKTFSDLVGPVTSFLLNANSVLPSKPVKSNSNLSNVFSQVAPIPKSGNFLNSQVQALYERYSSDSAAVTAALHDTSNIISFLSGNVVIQSEACSSILDASEESIELLSTSDIFLRRARHSTLGKLLLYWLISGIILLIFLDFIF
jgi:hypothetical protein